MTPSLQSRRRRCRRHQIGDLQASASVLAFAALLMMPPMIPRISLLVGDPRPLAHPEQQTAEFRPAHRESWVIPLEPLDLSNGRINQFGEGLDGLFHDSDFPASGTVNLSDLPIMAWNFAAALGHLRYGITTPPIPGIIPRVISGSCMKAFSIATMLWQRVASSVRRPWQAR